MEVDLSVDDKLNMIDDPECSSTSFTGNFILFIDTKNADIMCDMFINIWHFLIFA